MLKDETSGSVIKEKIYSLSFDNEVEWNNLGNKKENDTAASLRPHFFYLLDYVTADLKNCIRKK